MSESKQNVMSALAKNQPAVQGDLRPALTCKPMLRPGVAVFMNASEHRKFEGKHQALNVDTKEWMDMGPTRDEDVWIVENQGDPGPDIWCIGVFLCLQLMDTVAVNGKKRVATLQTPNLLATIPMKEVKGLERQLLYGAGQSAILSQ